MGLEGGFKKIERRITGTSLEEVEHSLEEMRRIADELKEGVKRLGAILSGAENIPKDTQGEIREAQTEGARLLDNLEGQLEDTGKVKNVYTEDEINGVVRPLTLTQAPFTVSLKESAREARSFLNDVRELIEKLKPYET